MIFHLQDIDAVFGTIYNSFKGDPVETLDAYKKTITGAFKRDDFIAEVDDVYVIQDYEKWLSAYVDKDLNHLHKEIDTQHQWKFEAVSESINFPFGVKTAYRAYSSSKVVEFDEVMPGQSIHKIGQETGLDPYTLHCTWQPEPYGINSNANRQGVEGTYLLREVPRGDIPVMDFEEDSQNYITLFMRRIRKAYNDNTNNAVRIEWEDWYQNVAPRLLQDPNTLQDNIIETTDDYITRLKASSDRDVRKLVIFPLATDGLLTNKDAYNRNIKWDISSKDEDLFDSEFKWPDRLAAAMNSVETSQNKTPQPARLYALTDQALINWRQSFSDSVEPYYQLVNALSKNEMITLAKRFFTYTGEPFSVTATNNKSNLLGKMRQWSRQVFVSIFKPANDALTFLVNNIKTRQMLPTEASCTMVKLKSKYLGNLAITKAEVREFCLDRDVTKKIFDAFLIMLANRNSQVCQSYRDINSDKEGFVPRKKSVFFPSQFFESVQAYTDNVTDICKILTEDGAFRQDDYHRMYFTIKLSDYETGILVLDLVDKKFFMLSPHRDKDSAEYSNGFVYAKDAVVRYLTALTRGSFDMAAFEVEVLPGQYFNYNETNFSAGLEVLLSLYLLETDTPIWYLRNEHIPVLKINFTTFLLLGKLPM